MFNYQDLREELKNFYWNVADDRSVEFFERCTKELDSLYDEGMSPCKMKVMQYKTITDMFDPVLFYNSPYFYEPGTMCAQCDGARSWRGGYQHPGGWTYVKNYHKFIEQNKDLFDKKNRHVKELLYLVCGPFNDTNQHFGYYYRPVMKTGFKGIYEKAQEGLKSSCTEKEREFLESLCDGLLCVKKCSEKFAEKARVMMESAPDEASRQNMKLISETAGRIPWERPDSFYEALNTYAFLRKVLGALEGIGFNSFGRVDLDLYPFYKNDIDKGVITKEQAYELVCKFLITWDMTYDHDMKMVEYSDHEMENTYVLGGCDAEGIPVYNEVTSLFLRATKEEGIIYPKIKCRFSKNSPKAYLDEINEAIIKGTTTVLYQNDDATIPALLRQGRTLAEAREYIVSGCWDLVSYGVEKPDCGGYVNLLKPFEYSIHKLEDKMDFVGIRFDEIDGAESFEEVYEITCRNIMRLFEERISVTREGGQIWDQVDPLLLFSSGFESCLEKKMDYTSGGTKYRDDHFLLFGLPNIVDSFMAIKELCFDKKKYTLKELLTAVRNNWEGFEEMRADAIRCHGWGDGNEESTALANRFNNDLAHMAGRLTGTYGGKVTIGHLTYTEIRWWGEKTLATPDGRFSGEYFSQGLTPSRLKKIPAVTDVIYSLSQLDPAVMGANSVVNIILPAGKTTLEVCEAFLRAVAGSAVQSLQLNCCSKEQLLDAQKHPEKYPELIVRVTGFSAKFTALSPDWQTEVITRNFYE